MFLRKTSSPRVVTLPDGSSLTRGDLPVGTTTLRWVARKKALVANAVRFGLLSWDEAVRAYCLSDEELGAWCRATESDWAAAPSEPGFRDREGSLAG